MLRTLSLALSLILSPLAHAQHHVIFGDSLSDEGRLYQKTDNQFPPSPFFEGRFSNGPVWPEYLEGTRESYAFAGAKSDYGNYLTHRLGSLVENTGLKAQIEEYLQMAHQTEDTTFYINIGSNDFLAFIDYSDGKYEGLVHRVVMNMIDGALVLRQAGAQQVVLFGLPDFTDTPYAQPLTTSERRLLKLISDSFNSMLKSKSKQLGFEYFDVNGLVKGMIAHPENYGFVNVTEACFDEINMIVCSNPDQYLFWDDKHPTTVVHKIVGLQMIAR